jgi:AMMECR1 domain-containing protein
MGKTTSHRLSDSVVALGRPLREVERRSLERGLRALLRFQRDLRAFPTMRGAPDATPYVSLYARGALRGCYGCAEGTPNERVARAFLLALADARYGGVHASDRDELAGEVTYITRARPVRADEIANALESGVHGVGLFDDEASVVLLPSVARQHGHDASATLEVLAKKAKRAPLREGIVWVLDVDEVSSRGTRSQHGRRAAQAWLESLVDARGVVAFDMNGASGALGHAGPMRHGRAAVAIEALGALGSKKTRAARVWLAREIDRGLRRGDVDDWPTRRDVVLGTLALASRAGVDVPLEPFANALRADECSPWHAGQAASMLGARTPKALWDRCVRDLEAHPFAPYTLFAAIARRDGVVIDRCTRALVSAIRTHAPFAGGASITATPETALTAVAAEALALISSASARRAARAARDFVRARQILDVSAALHVRTLGAFRASPIAPIFRCDVTAHAALASFTRDT